MYKKKQGKTFHYLEFGSKNLETILCLHGYANKSLMFESLANYLENKYRVIALDLPILHQAQNFFSIELLAAYVYSFVCKMNLKKFTLVGFSLGGLISVQYAFLHPKEIKSLYLLNSLPQLIISKHSLAIYKFIKPVLKTKKFCKLFSFPYVNSSLRNIFNQDPLPYMVRQRIKKAPFSILGTLFSAIDQQLADAFSSLSIPKTIVLFKDDKILKWIKYKNFANQLDCRLVVFDKGGHASNEDYWKSIKTCF